MKQDYRRANIARGSQERTVGLNGGLQRSGSRGLGTGGGLGQGRTNSRGPHVGMRGLGAASNAPRQPMLPPQGSGLPNGHAGKGYSGGLGAFDRKTIEEKADKEMAGFGDLLARVEQLEKEITQKNAIISKQGKEISSLRQRNFELRAKATDAEDKQKAERQKRKNDARKDERAELAMIAAMQKEQMRNQEQQMLMQAMMESMGDGQTEEERLLQRAIEESKDGGEPNPDQMTYEQLMELGERNGAVSKGLTKVQINSIRERAWVRNGDTSEDTCSICFDVFSKFQKYKKLPKCGHEYHSKCINRWLEDQKHCPMCNEDVL